MVLILTTMCIVTHTLDMLIGFCRRLNEFNIFSLEIQAFVSFFRQLTFLLMFMMHAFDGVIIFMMDNNLRLIIKEIFESVRVSQFKKVFYMFLTVEYLKNTILYINPLLYSSHHTQLVQISPVLKLNFE